jgi:hypothetical protein
MIDLRKLFLVCLTAVSAVVLIADPKQPSEEYGVVLADSPEFTVWTVASTWKIGPKWAVPKTKARSAKIALAKNEYESFQIILTPKTDLKAVAAAATIDSTISVELLRGEYLHLESRTDSGGWTGDTPDPIHPITKQFPLKKNRNAILWIRVFASANAKPGKHAGRLILKTKSKTTTIPFEVEVFDFKLPDTMTCRSAFGCRSSEIFHYHHLKDKKSQTALFAKYLDTFSKHHISPFTIYSNVDWKADAVVPKEVDSRFVPDGGDYVDNEAHNGKNSLLVRDNDSKNAIHATSRLIPLNGAAEIAFSFWYRTLLPETMATVKLIILNAGKKQVKEFIMNVCGDGKWMRYKRKPEKLPKTAKFARVEIYPAVWTVNGKHTGAAWFDDFKLTDKRSKKELIIPNRGSFETDPATFAPAELAKLRSGIKFDLDADNWADAIEKSLKKYHFNSFYVWIKGMGGVTWCSIDQSKFPTKGGRTYSEISIEYQIIFEKYMKALRALMKRRGILKYAYVYMFDEPSPSHIPFLKRNYARMKRWFPEIKTILPTNKVLKQLDDEIDYWVLIHKVVDDFKGMESKGRCWSYLCTDPKTPYIGEFIDRPGIDLRLWGWQNYSRNLKGVLMWETVFWRMNRWKPGMTNPYEKPMVRDEAHGWNWGNGDGRLIYPPKKCFATDKPVMDAPVDSIRMEMIRDGIEDYEYFVILKRLLNSAKIADDKKREYSKLLKFPARIRSLTKFSKNPRHILKTRGKIARAIVDILSGE